MNPDFAFNFFPDLRGSSFAVMALICLVLFGCTLLIEWWRRIARTRTRLSQEWSDVQALMREKGLAEDQRAQLVDLLQRCAPRQPFHAVTRRSHFDDCASAEISRLRAALGVDELDDAGAALRAIRTALGLDFVPLGQGITTTRELYLEQHLWVAPVTGQEPTHWHPAIVTGVNEAHYFIMLQDAGEPAVRDGADVHCRMWREDDGRYAFDARLVRASNRAPGWMMEHTDDLRRTQARAHYRVTHEQPADFEVVEAPMNADYDGVLERDAVARIHGRVTSLSGGGFAALLPQPLPPQALLRLGLELEEGYDRLTVVGRIVGSQSLFGGRYLIRCAFVGMSDEHRNHITQHVFRRQTHLSKKDAQG